MPSASDLCKLYSKDALIKEFIDGVILSVERSAKCGDRYECVDVPLGLTRKDIEIHLQKAFPDCKISWKWFLQCYQIKWA
jgi:hypothetical protein